MKKRELFNNETKELPYQRQQSQSKGAGNRTARWFPSHRVCHGSYMYACGEDRGIFQMNGEVIIIKT